jgi:hypothetical protein
MGFLFEEPKQPASEVATSLRWVRLLLALILIVLVIAFML